MDDISMGFRTGDPLIPKHPKQLATHTESARWRKTKDLLQRPSQPKKTIEERSEHCSPFAFIPSDNASLFEIVATKPNSQIIAENEKCPPLLAICGECTLCGCAARMNTLAVVRTPYGGMCVMFDLWSHINKELALLRSGNRTYFRLLWRGDICWML